MRVVALRRVVTMGRAAVDGADRGTADGGRLVRFGVDGGSGARRIAGWWLGPGCDRPRPWRTALMRMAAWPRVVAMGRAAGYGAHAGHTTEAGSRSIAAMAGGADADGGVAADELPTILRIVARETGAVLR